MGLAGGNVLAIEVPVESIEVLIFSMMAAGPEAKRPPHIVLLTTRLLPLLLTFFLATRIHQR
jgi:hypothetical protein